MGVLHRIALRARSPLFLVLIFVGVLHAVGIGWGLPASDGWDNDGVAPRDFLPGLAQTFSPGRFYTYPPVHLAILAVLTAPITIVGIVKAPSLAVSDVVREMLGVPYMTAMAYVARVVALVMSLGIVFFLARAAEELRASALGVDRRDRRVVVTGVLTAAFVGTNASLTYYAHTSNLDVPYLFWATWSLLTFVRVFTRSEPRLFRRALILAVLAVGTKDQAYALFLLSLPVALALWFVDPWARANWRPIMRELAIALGIAALVFCVTDAVIFNPSGFRARVGFLTGHASQDYVEYTNDWSGRGRLLRDAGEWFIFQYPYVFAPLIVLGVARAARWGKPAAMLLPLLAAISFTIAFNFTARRSSSRFVMPQALLFGVYGGIGIELVVRHIIGQAVASIVLAKGIFLSMAVDANLLLDPRYDAERWLAAHVRPGDTIETYGLNVYLPRMTAIAHVVRVDPEPIAGRNPLPGVEEVQAPFEEAPARGARWIVVSTAWAWRYLIRPDAPNEGRQLAPTQLKTAADTNATRWFRELVECRSVYWCVHAANYDARIFPPVDVHGTSARPVWIYERAH